jgi:Fic family protein
MGYEERRIWIGTGSYGLPRASRRTGEYRAYVPDPLVGRKIVLPSSLYADVSDAEDAIRRLNQESPTLSSLEALARLLLRAEAVSSSRIEGLVLPARQLVQEDVARQVGLSTNATARAILGNIAALRLAVEELANKPILTVADFLSLHRELMEHTEHPENGGKVRTVQNWIGGSDYNPCNADFVPPPPEHVPALLDDLVDYVNSDADSPLLQAAMAHAQFETIHPFIDGNGRTGRALIHLVLRRRGLAPRYVPPISLILATRSRDYIQGLTAARFLGPPDANEAMDGLAIWISTFAAATTQACANAHRFGQQIDELVGSWRDATGEIRKNSATDRLLRVLPAAPIITVGTAARLIARSDQQTAEAVARLTAVGVLQEITLRKRNRAYEAVGLLDALTLFERSLASPTGDTQTAPPVRRVPRRLNLSAKSLDTFDPIEDSE